MPHNADERYVPPLVLKRRRRLWARRAAIVLASIIAIGVVALYETRPRPQPLDIPGKWHLVLDSEFDGTTLPDGWKEGWLASGVTLPVNSDEEDCYSPLNVTFPGDGAMNLNVTKVMSRCHGETKPFSGALVSTNPDDGQGPGFQYTYGVLQARVYLPADGAAFADWPAVWAAGQAGAKYGEDDVIEGLSGEACWHFHEFSGESGGCDKALRPGWHTVASYWRKGAISFYYDGIKVGQITSGITSRPMYLLLDNTTTADGPIADSMRVKYVRVWQAS